MSVNEWDERLTRPQSYLFIYFTRSQTPTRVVRGMRQTLSKRQVKRDKDICLPGRPHRHASDVLWRDLLHRDMQDFLDLLNLTL